MDPRHLFSFIIRRWALALVAMFALVPAARAQLMLNNGAVIVTKPSSYMQVNGAYQNLTGSIDDSGTVTITTDFTNSVAATSSNAGLYNIGGNFTNNGAFNKKTGTVDLYGSSNQNVGGTVITRFYNLQFTGGGSKTLTQQEIVDSNCYFTNGICYTTQTDVLHFDSLGNWVNNSGMPTSGCISYVDGPCEKDMNSTNRFWFPVGESGRANTCAITPQSATDATFLTEYFDSSFYDVKDYQAPLKGVSSVQYWFGDIVSPNPASTNAIIRLYWIPGDYIASWMKSVSALVVARWDTLAPNPPGPQPAWVTAGESAIMPGATYNFGWIESSVVLASQYGTATVNRPFTLSTDSADNSLPIEMGPFTARQVGNSVLLDWKTYSEINTLGFEVDRSAPAATSGTSGQHVVHSFINDTALEAKSPWGAAYQTADSSLPSTGVYIYDLYEIDKDGIRTHVGTQSVDFEEIAIPTAPGLFVSPNPLTARATVELDLQRDSHAAVELYDVTGRRVLKVADGDYSAGRTLLSFDASRLAPGAYCLVAQAGSERITKNIIVH